MRQVPLSDEEIDIILGWACKAEAEYVGGPYPADEALYGKLEAAMRDKPAVGP